MTLRRIAYPFAFLVASAGGMAACGDDNEACDAVANTGCDDGQVCETTSDGKTGCFAPLVVEGRVFDLGSDVGVEAARVVGLDVNGGAVGAVAVSAADGTYSLRVPAERDGDGAIVAGSITLRADAAGYQGFPSGVRQALPIDYSLAQSEGGKLVIKTSLTDVGLYALEAGAGSGQIHGTVSFPEGVASALIVAEPVGTTGEGTSAIADREGDYRIFNLPAGDYDVRAYARGGNWTPAAVTLVDGDDKDVDLALSGEPTGTVTGSVSIVNAFGGATTSVLLVAESTFDETLGRGEMPPGLRTPDPGLPGDIQQAYTFEGVPAGRYVVLAAFENDQLVRDPDLSIGGTSILHIEVTPGGTTDVPVFKVTEALEIMSPGASGPELLTTGTPTFSWKDDSSEDQYTLQCFDALGKEVWNKTIAGVAGQDPSVVYDGDALLSGMTYQIRITSWAKGSPISRSEDLRGVFIAP